MVSNSTTEDCLTDNTTLWCRESRLSHLQPIVREFVTFSFKIREFNKFFKICKNILGYFWGYLDTDNGIFSKYSQAKTKFDSEMNWSTYDIIHSEIEKKAGQQR